MLKQQGLQATGRANVSWMIALVLLGVLLRTLLLGGYEALPSPDSSTYIAAARDLASGGDFAQSAGRRTPGYPLFITAVGEEPSRIAAVQMALGIGTSLLLFFIALHMTGRPGVAFAAGLSYSLNLQQLFLEAALLTEPLTTFMIAAMVLALLVTLRRLRSGGSAIGLAVLVGACGAAAIMVRPQFIFLPLLLPPLVIYAASGLRWPSARALGHAALVVLPIALAVLGWAKVVEAKTGYFTMSTQSGFGVVNHSVNFIELAPPEFAQVRDILLKHRAERIAASGHAGNTIWYAWPEIRQATGWSLPEASRQLQRMSTQIFAAHPLLYAQSVLQPWLEFWTVPILWAPDRVQPAWMAAPLEAAWWVQHKLLRLANLLFVGVVAAVVVSRRARHALNWDLDATAISALILASSVLQALADRGAGSRYAMTVQALVVLMLLVCSVRLRFLPPAEPIAQALSRLDSR